jgi:hypothetical protein
MGDSLSNVKELNNIQTKLNASHAIHDEIHDQVLVESALCYEVSKTVLNVLSIYVMHHKVTLLDFLEFSLALLLTF